MHVCICIGGLGAMSGRARNELRGVSVQVHMYIEIVVYTYVNMCVHICVHTNKYVNI